MPMGLLEYAVSFFNSESMNQVNSATLIVYCVTVTLIIVHCSNKNKGGGK